MTGPYVICFNNGCMADYEASGELIGKLKKGQGLVVQGINGAGQPISLVLPLTDFAKAYDGAADRSEGVRGAAEEAAGRIAAPRRRGAQEAREPGGAADAVTANRISTIEARGLRASFISAALYQRSLRVTPAFVMALRIVVCEKPVAVPIERIDQWVASAGIDRSVRSITAAT